MSTSILSIGWVVPRFMLLVIKCTNEQMSVRKCTHTHFKLYIVTLIACNFIMKQPAQQTATTATQRRNVSRPGATSATALMRLHSNVQVGHFHPVV